MPKEQKQEAKDLTIITTHVNADFDALASMLAAQKLYPDGLVVFPGSQEKNLKNFFINSMVYLFNMADISDIDFAKVKRLVLVDTRQPRRIGKLAKLLKRTDIDIHIYDHHPATHNDIKGDLVVHRMSGANVTLLIEIISQKGIDISEDEATIMCLGIYEDTGSFTFPSTTEKDFKAAAFLLSKGANLNVVSDLIARELSPEQVGLLNDLIQSASRYNVGGLEVVVSIWAQEGESGEAGHDRPLVPRAVKPLEQLLVDESRGRNELALDERLLEGADLRYVGRPIAAQRQGPDVRVYEEAQSRERSRL